MRLATREQTDKGFVSGNRQSVGCCVCNFESKRPQVSKRRRKLDVSDRVTCVDLAYQVSGYDARSVDSSIVETESISRVQTLGISNDTLTGLATRKQDDISRDSAEHGSFAIGSSHLTRRKARDPK
ncbi:hypothetical protein F66182_7856 [Fusarium sp. NRRL 66182]|nr:hypothetical protein F66182_7856 [Fusarium sp. NRRL 66182]